MAYIYESTQAGVFNFTIPGKGKTVTLFYGSQITVENKLTGGYLRVLRYIGETNKPTISDTTTTDLKKEDIKPVTKVVDKIVKVIEEVNLPNSTDSTEIIVDDSIVNVSENTNQTTENITITSTDVESNTSQTNKKSKRR